MIKLNQNNFDYLLPLGALAVTSSGVGGMGFPPFPHEDRDIEEKNLNSSSKWGEKMKF